MPAFHAQKERRLLEAARRDGCEDRYYDDLRDALEKKHLNPMRDFSIRQLFEQFVPDGREVVDSWNPRHAQGHAGKGVQLLEAGVDTTAFSNISGQLVYTAMMEAWNDPVFIADELCTTVPTQFDGEKIPGVTGIGDEAEIVNESEPYPMVGFGEEWIDTPSLKKRGFIVPLTKEVVYGDRTGLVLRRAAENTVWLRINKEKRVLDGCLGLTSLYRRNGGAAINPYGDNSGSHDFDNLAATNALVDWTDIENAELLFDGMVDPNTGEPILVHSDTIVLPTALKWTGGRIKNATEIRYGDGASNTTQTISPNPLNGNTYKILSNQYVKSRTASASTWFVGDFKNAFWYMEHWGITSLQAPPNSELEFTNDIVARWKLTEKGTLACVEPRRVVKSTG